MFFICFPRFVMCFGLICYSDFFAFHPSRSGCLEAAQAKCCLALLEQMAPLCTEEVVKEGQAAMKRSQEEAKLHGPGGFLLLKFFLGVFS